MRNKISFQETKLFFNKIEDSFSPLMKKINLFPGDVLFHQKNGKYTHISIVANSFLISDVNQKECTGMVTKYQYKSGSRLISIFDILGDIKQGNIEIFRNDKIIVDPFILTVAASFTSNNTYKIGTSIKNLLSQNLFFNTFCIKNTINLLKVSSNSKQVKSIKNNYYTGNIAKVKYHFINNGWNEIKTINIPTEEIDPSRLNNLIEASKNGTKLFNELNFDANHKYSNSIYISCINTVISYRIQYSIFSKTNSYDESNLFDYMVSCSNSGIKNIEKRKILRKIYKVNKGILPNEKGYANKNSSVKDINEIQIRYFIKSLRKGFIFQVKMMERAYIRAMSENNPIFKHLRKIL